MPRTKTGTAGRGRARERRLSASLEDYLEAIFRTTVKKRAARPKDIAQRLKVNSSSVTGALHNLDRRGLVNYTPYEVITLTDKGESVAKDIVRRHEALRDLFENVLSVEKSEAERTACRLEHAISRPILERLIEFVEFVKSCPRAGPEWIRQFRCRCEAGGRGRDCEACIERCVGDVKADPAVVGDAGGFEAPLAALQPGQRGEIVRVPRTSPAHRRLRDMGITPGSTVAVGHIAASGGDIDVRVKGYHLTLAPQEAEGIIVSVGTPRQPLAGAAW